MAAVQIAGTNWPATSAVGLIPAGHWLNEGSYWIMHGRTVTSLATMRTTADVPAFSGVTPMGGTLYGIPILTTSAIPIDTGDDSYIALLDASDLVVAEGGVRLDASGQADLQLRTDPASPATSTISLFQSGFMAIKIERTINYQMARPCIALLHSVSY